MFIRVKSSTGAMCLYNINNITCIIETGTEKEPSVKIYDNSDADSYISVDTTLEAINSQIEAAAGRWAESVCKV